MLTTQRLKIRRFEVQDAGFVFELLTDPAWIQNIGYRGVRWHKDAEAYISKLQESYRQNGFGLYCVDELSSLKAIGMCGLVRRSEFEYVDLGFAFLPAARGQGYAQEASLAVLRLAQDLGLKRVLGVVDPQNSASIRVLQKVGMKFDSLSENGMFDKQLQIFSLDIV